MTRLINARMFNEFTKDGKNLFDLHLFSTFLPKRAAAFVKSSKHKNISLEDINELMYGEGV